MIRRADHHWSARLAFVPHLAAVADTIQLAARACITRPYARHPGNCMSQSERLARLLKEFERVGVDPNTISAGLAVSEDDALRVLAALADRAGPTAFLSQLRVAVSPPKS
jgi:hypothetical protein